LEDAGIKELGRHPNDKEALKQGSKFSNRLFLPIKKERNEVLRLISGEINMSEFVSSKEITSDNGLLLKDLISHVIEVSPLHLPSQYKEFICDISKSSAVAGLLQVTSAKPLNILKKYCSETFNLRHSDHLNKLRLMEQELPSFWPKLLAIANFEETNYLPKSVSQIVLKLVQVRENTFKSCPQRFQEEYYDYIETGEFAEHPSQYYPVHKLIKYPKTYTVSGVTDEDHCEKNFTQHGDFCSGIFNIGCCCSYMITYGYELMIAPESARHFFRFLMCRLGLVWFG